MLKSPLEIAIMHTMLSALKDAGILADTTLREVKKRQELDSKRDALESRLDRAEKRRQLALLEGTTSTSFFRAEAHELLLAFPEEIGNVLELARLEPKKFEVRPSGKVLIKQLMTLRGDLAKNKLTFEERQALIQSGFPKTQ